MDIKFRGLNNETNEYVYGYYAKLVEGARRFNSIISDVSGELTRFYIHDSSTISQYTGLKDIDGKEIYGGDKIKGGTKDELCKVIWQEECGRWIALGETYKILGHKFKNFKVVDF